MAAAGHAGDGGDVETEGLRLELEVEQRVARGRGGIASELFGKSRKERREAPARRMLEEDER